ncbi:hypothetical protein FIBSPDRAFT_770421 [Athelia psychrophila]|uniref:Uncharacterized protein n=1 Tax=Athelia psychrophila TaxID=1759441 RepID=A0A167T796_9AGAM|nr:hypothetical protein FIBSPDRAFT_770421 [Fibularhizoctonia sp. CBS 109695]
MYLNAVMPKEPKLDQSNHYMEPLITQLNNSYENGVKFTRTYKHHEGRQTRSAIAVFVNDLPGGKKVAQMAGHQSKSHFCSLCTLHKDRINEIDPAFWVPRDVVALRHAAYAWKNATSKAERDAIFAKYGVRWSELWRLSYYDPIKMLVIDGMHNLFEGLVQFHCRYVLGIDGSEAETEETIPTTREIDGAKNILSSSRSSEAAKGRIKFHVLKAICREKGLLPEQSLSRLTKRFMLNLLQTSELQALHAALRSTQRPSWQRGPPVNLGCKTHGKLKADQWRSAIEFDVPVSLAQSWAHSDAEVQNDEKKQRQRQLLDSTMLLAVAVGWGTSDVTSQIHAYDYTRHMMAYLQTILMLYPSFKLRPNHHGALHIGPFLLQFGPMRGWWMYPFERIIGILQKTNTNSKLGKTYNVSGCAYC